MIAKMASAASTKALGVVIDDAAVTPRYVHGFSPVRELPIIWKIARGSLVNKAIIIVALMVLSEFLPQVLTPILMLGGAYLCFEGAEKVWEYLTGHHAQKTETAQPVVGKSEEMEKAMVKGAITTDFILSAEIMMISLNEVAQQPLAYRAIALVVVAILITTLVYGVVALIVKMDDIGLKMASGERTGSRKFGEFLVDAMPRLLTILSVVGVIAMMWVGGHILIAGANTLGWSAPMDLLHWLAAPVHGVAGVGGFLAWLVDTLASAVIGFLVGTVIVLLLKPFHRHDVHAEGTEAH